MTSLGRGNALASACSSMLWRIRPTTTGRWWSTCARTLLCRRPVAEARWTGYLELPTGAAGFEPATSRLTAGRSAVELHPKKAGRGRYQYTMCLHAAAASAEDDGPDAV